MSDTQEKEDGSAIVELPKEDKDQIVVEEEQKPGKDLSRDDDDDDDDDGASEITPHEEGDTDAQRQAKNRENYKARQLRKEKKLAAVRADKARIANLSKQNQELLTRVAKLENNQQGLQVSRLEGSIEQQQDLISTIKQHMITAQDRSTYVELADRLADEKLKLKDLQTQKDNTVKAATTPPNLANPHKAETARRTKDWMSRHGWFDSNGRGVDSKIAIAVSESLEEEGFDSSAGEYWEELDDRLKRQLPHRYERKARSSPPVGGSRNENSASDTPHSATSIHISAARKQAMIEAGVWNDPDARTRIAKKYAQYDKQSKVG